MYRPPKALDFTMNEQGEELPNIVVTLPLEIEHMRFADPSQSTPFAVSVSEVSVPQPVPVTVTVAPVVDALPTTPPIVKINVPG